VIWVVDDSLYEGMLQSASIRAAEHAFDWPGLLATSLEKWKQCFPSFKAWKNELILPASVNEVTHWVKELRAELQKWLRKSQYSEEVIYAIVKSLDLIHESPIQHISQTDLSKKVNVSKSYFSTSFKEILGISFIHYIQWLSISTAKDMILNTNHPIYWIAEQCGFMDQRYFSKLFKEQTGTLPSELRQSQQNR
jgi:two-component system response regulator YesN